MDVEKLIILISERKSLWDMRDKNYHMRDVQRKLWKEVAEEINADAEDVKNKRRGLRDTFRKEFQKSKQHKSGDGADSVIISTWPYYKFLLFLSDSIQRRKLHGNVSPVKGALNNESEYVDSELVNEMLLLETPDIACSQESVPHETKQQPSTSSIPKNKEIPQRDTSNIYKRKKLGKQSVDDQFLEIEKAKLKIFSESDKMKEDSEYQFLISLLPYLRSVPNNGKLIVRNKLQQIFIEEEELAFRMSHSQGRVPLVYASQGPSSVSSNYLTEGSTSTPLPSPASLTNNETSLHLNTQLQHQPLQQYFSHFNDVTM